MPIDRVRSQMRRKEGELRDASIVLVGTEGEKTEAIYLDAFGSARVKVVTVVCDDGRSSPKGVLNKVSEAITRFNFGSGDTFWIIVDKDQWKEKEFSEVFALCRQKGITHVVSNERFEVFLCYHFTDFVGSPEFENGEYEKFLRAKLGVYRKNKFDAQRLRSLAKTACDACASADGGSHALWPDPPNSRAYLLVRAILEKLTPK